MEKQICYITCEYAHRNGFDELSWELIKLLLQKGAYIETQNSIGSTLLFYVAQSGTTEMIDYLVDKGANINHISPIDDHNLIYWANENKD